MLAKGVHVDDGGGEIVTHETKSGGAVFSVGSTTWTSSILVDDGMSRLTRNVIERFLSAGAQTEGTAAAAAEAGR